MDNERKNLTCPKCGSEIELTENQTIGHCSFCDSLIPLPYFMTNRDAVDSETYHNMLNRINKANAFNMQYQFHRSFNLFDKLIKNNYNLNINDYYPYFGKALAQYGVYFVLNDKLEQELICLKYVKESIFDNENYQMALSYADTNTEAIIKTIATQIDNFQKDLQKALISTKPFDVCILVDTSTENHEAKIDTAVAVRIKEKLAKLNYSANVTQGLLEHVNRDFVVEMFRNLTMANHLVIVSTNHNHLNASLFRHIWMTYYGDDELAETMPNRMSIITDDTSIKEELPLQNVNFFKSTQLDDHFNNLVSCLKTIKQYEEECKKAMPMHADLLELLSNQQFEEVKDILNKKVEETNLDYVEWWIMFLTKHNASDNASLLSKAIDPDESYYFIKSYLVSPRYIKKDLYEYYVKAKENLENLAVIDENYDKEVEEAQKALYRKAKINVLIGIIPIVIVTILDFLTFSITNFWSLLLMLCVNAGAYAIFSRNLLKLLSIGRLPDSIKNENDKNSYILQIKKALKPSQVAKFVPSSKTKKARIFGYTILLCCALLTLSFFIKETVVSAKNKNLNYYYLFNTVVVTGGHGEEIVIPKTINKRTVKKIGNNAFENNKTVKTVIINNGVKEIGSSAFKGCQNLENVTIPSTIEKIDSGHAPFEDCVSLKEFLYQGTEFTPTELLGKDYQEKMFEINFIRK